MPRRWSLRIATAFVLLLACGPAGTAEAAKVTPLLTGGVLTADGRGTGGEDILHDVTNGSSRTTRRVVMSAEAQWVTEWLYDAGYPHTLAGPGRSSRSSGSIVSGPQVAFFKGGGTETIDETNCTGGGCSTAPTQRCDFGFLYEPQATAEPNPKRAAMSPIDELRRDNCQPGYLGYVGGMPWALAETAKLSLFPPDKPARVDKLDATQPMDITLPCPPDWRQGASDRGYCNVTVTGKSDASLICALCVTRISFKQAAKPGGRLAAVPKAGAREGSPVHVFLTVRNIWYEEITTAPVMRDGSGRGRDLKGSFARGSGFLYPPDARTRVHFVWKTGGLGRKAGPPRRVQFLSQFGGGEARLRILPPKDDAGR